MSARQQGPRSAGSAVAPPSRRSAPYLLFAAAAVIPYATVLDAPFLYDDTVYVVDNPQVRDAGAIGAMLRSSYPPRHEAQGLYRPLVTFSYAVDFAIFRLEPFAFHLTNVMLHALATIAAYAMLRTVAPELATAAAILFAVHPVHVEAVSWIVGRAEVLCALFLFAGLAARALPVAAISVLLALLSKEMAITAPLLELCLAVVPSRRERAPGRAAAFAAVAIVYLGARAAVLGGLVPRGSFQTLEGVGLPGRLPAVFSAYASDLRLLAFPAALAVDHPWLTVPTWGWPAAGAGIVLAGALLAVGLAWRPLLIPVLWLDAAILPVSHLVPFGSTYAERFLYIPSISICLAVAALASRLPRRAGLVATGALVAALGARTVIRNQDWRDAGRFYETAIAASPGNATLRNNYGRVLIDRASSALAAERAALVARAEKLFEGAVARNGRLAPALANLGIIRAQEGRLPEARDLLERAVAADPTYARGFNNLGNVYAILGRAADARKAYGSALALDPGYVDALENLRKLGAGR
ncbi:MAG: tetratricopeptide repeat protein [Acidobacteriota bacterium]